MDRHATDDVLADGAAPADCAFELKVIDHVGIRVTDRDRAVTFHRFVGRLDCVVGLLPASQ